MKNTGFKPVSASRGFTLIELMMVVVIVAVIAALAVPSFLDFAQKNKVKGAAEDIYGLVLLGKSEGPIRDSDIFFSVEGSGSDAWCIGFAQTASCSCNDADIADTTCRVNVGDVPVAQLVRAENHPDVAVTGSSFNFIRPRNSASAQTINIALGNWELELRVTTEGSVILCNPNSSARTIPGYEACPS